MYPGSLVESAPAKPAYLMARSTETGGWHPFLAVPPAIDPGARRRYQESDNGVRVPITGVKGRPWESAVVPPL
jgi:hypothetical protein